MNTINKIVYAINKIMLTNSVNNSMLTIKQQ